MEPEHKLQHFNKKLSIKLSTSQSSFRGKSVRESITIPYKPVEDFNIKITNNELHEIIRFFDINPQRAMSNLQSLVSRFSDTEAKRRWLVNWVDHRGLDLLHCAIISEKPNVISYLLRDTYLFPQTHFPRANPYAHLAAMLGNKDCLEALLISRPGDYFAASEPHHAVRLPPDVMRRLKLNNETGMSNKNLARVVRMVKHDTAAVERKMARLVGEESLEKEIKELESTFVEISHARPKRLPYQSLQDSLKISGSQQPLGDIEQVKLPHMQILGGKREEKVTVYMNVFDDDTLDRVENARYRDAKPNVLSTSANKSLGLPTTISTQSLKQALPKENKKQRFSRKSTLLPPNTSIEFGVRKIKKYKEFIPVFETKTMMFEDPNKYMDKTPLTMAAEKNHYECVNFLLKRFHLKKGSSSRENKETIALAAKARSPEALALLLKSNVSPSDYQNAVLLSLREMYPDSLKVLLTLGGKNRSTLFEGTNLFHILYTQSLSNDNCRYKMLPEMTRILLQCSEDVNARFPPRTFPMYTLIQCAFNIAVGEKSMHYVKCLKILLNAKANPHFDEMNKAQTKNPEAPTINILRPAYFSAIHCIFANAEECLDHFELGYWSHIILYKFVEAIETCDKTPRRMSNDNLLLYMSYICRLGLNRRVLRNLLRYGANPDYAIDGKYPLNLFFDELFPFLVKFEVKHRFQSYDDMLDTLLILCRAMSQRNLHKAVVYFLDNHLFSTPIQALSLSHKFCYYTNKMLLSPRSLTHIARNFIWVTCGRNSKKVRSLPIDDYFIQTILP